MNPPGQCATGEARKESTVTATERLDLLFLFEYIDRELRKIRKIPYSPRYGTFAPALRNALELLKEAWSPMAIRNLLSDILRETLGLQKNGDVTGSKDLKEIVDDLVEQLKDQLGTHAPTSQRYTAAICLGYKVKTAGSKYTGKTDDRADMLKRCGDMKQAIRAAYRLADVTGSHNANPHMLKIFMAPEFFFRGIHGAYDHELVHGNGKQPGLMEILAQETDLPQYRDYLFILGSAILAAKSTKTVCETCGQPPKFVVDKVSGKSSPQCPTSPTHKKFKERTIGARVENVAYVRKEGESHLVTKELVSGIDYVMDDKRGMRDLVTVRGETLNVESYKESSGYKVADPVVSKFLDERMGGSIFTIDGITFGLEVCLDHAATTANPNSGRLEHAGNIQIQLVPSAGMGITHFKTVRDGFIFNVDGITPHVHVVNQDQGQFHHQSSGFRTGKLSRAWAAIRRGVGQTVGAPRMTGGASGPVIFCGPYDIPDV